MRCTIQQLTCNQNPDKVKELNLCSSSNSKIHKICQLDSFIRLRILNLSNNMIGCMEGLNNLRNLRVLNLEFNQIRLLEGTQNLAYLEELYLSYNQIEEIGGSLGWNMKLRVLHLAYNDIKTLDGISVLYQSKQTQQSAENTQDSPYNFPDLATISLSGNPLISTINYFSFFKMLIPSLRCIDNRSINDDIMDSSVCAQEEVVILREAINKLLDERNAVVRELEGYGNMDKRKGKRTKFDEGIGEQRAKEFNQLIQSLEQYKHKSEATIQYSKQMITNLSHLYAQNLKKYKNVNRSQSSRLTFSLNQKNLSENELEEQIQDPVQRQSVSKNKDILIQIKKQESKLRETQNKLRKVTKVLNCFEQRMKEEANADMFRIVLQIILFGFEESKCLSSNEYYKLCKKYILKDQTDEMEEITGLIEYCEILKSIIYGEKRQESLMKVDIRSVCELKAKIKGKGLLQIIAQLKSLNAQQTTKFTKFQKERKKFIQKFQQQSQELSRSWEQLKKQRSEFEYFQEKERSDQNESMNKKQYQMRRKYKITEEEQKQKIMELKDARDRISDQVQKLRMTLAETEYDLERKFTELEQFEAHFNEFIEEKEHIKSLELQIQEITSSLKGEQQKFLFLQDRVKELRLQQGILQNKISKSQLGIRDKNRELNELDHKTQQLQKQHDQIKRQLDADRQVYLDIANNNSIKLEEVKNLQKAVERAKKNCALMEEKVRNIQCIETNKKNIIKELQLEVKSLREDKQNLLTQVQNMDMNIELKRDQLLTYQKKIHENKLATENLSEINKSMSEMMIRQSELKRNIIELQIQNRNLLEMRNHVLDDYRMKNYL